MHCHLIYPHYRFENIGIFLFALFVAGGYAKLIEEARA